MPITQDRVISIITEHDLIITHYTTMRDEAIAILADGQAAQTAGEPGALFAAVMATLSMLRADAARPMQSVKIELERYHFRHNKRRNERHAAKAKRNRDAIGTTMPPRATGPQHTPSALAPTSPQSRIVDGITPSGEYRSRRFDVAVIRNPNIAQPGDIEKFFNSDAPRKPNPNDMLDDARTDANLAAQLQEDARMADQPMTQAELDEIMQLSGLNPPQPPAKE